MKENVGAIGLALAGHAYRAVCHPKAQEYENDFTDYINLVIAECKAKQTDNNRMNLTLKGRWERPRRKSASVSAPLQGKLF